MTAQPNIKAGKVKGLAISSPARSPLVPDLPTIAEAGLPGFQSLTWFGLLGPANTPKAVVDRVNAEMNKALQLSGHPGALHADGLRAGRRNARRTSRRPSSATRRSGRRSSRTPASRPSSHYPESRTPCSPGISPTPRSACRCSRRTSSRPRSRSPRRRACRRSPRAATPSTPRSPRRSRSRSSSRPPTASARTPSRSSGTARSSWASTPRAARPPAWTPERFKGRTAMPVHGWDAVTVPGCVSAWVALSQRYGKLPFAGPLPGGDPLRARRLHGLADHRRQLGAAGAEPQGLLGVLAGPSCRRTARRARASASTARSRPRRWRRSPPRKGESFYRGKLAERIALASRSDDGAHTVEDFAAHRCDWVEPISIEYRGYRLHEIPPNGQGIVALMALGILRHFDLAALPGGRRRQPAPADRGDEARLRRRLPLRVGPGHDGVRRRGSSSPTTTSPGARRRST